MLSKNKLANGVWLVAALIFCVLVGFAWKVSQRKETLTVMGIGFKTKMEDLPRVFGAFERVKNPVEMIVGKAYQSATLDLEPGNIVRCGALNSIVSCVAFSNNFDSPIFVVGERLDCNGYPLCRRGDQLDAVTQRRGLHQIYADRRIGTFLFDVEGGILAIEGTNNEVRQVYLAKDFESLKFAELFWKSKTGCASALGSSDTEAMGDKLETEFGPASTSGAPASPMTQCAPRSGEEGGGD